MEDYEKSAESLSESEENDKNGVGRMYECRFCKRGFTNAQALGGHMNIHRKDKAKATQYQNKNQTYFANTFNTTITMDTPNPSPLKFSSQPIMPSLFHDIFDHHHHHHHHHHHLRHLLGVDLSLKINSSSSTIHDQPAAGSGKQNNNQNQHSDYKNNEIDLELRLGYNP
ncbi:unnamed protein product [Amaranthus hypochondriacus]